MRILVFFFLLLAYELSHAQSRKELARIDTLASRLQNAYEELGCSNSLACQKKFLKLFPSRFKDFETLFAFPDTEYEPYCGPLCGKAGAYLRCLMHLDSIDERSRYRKLISVSAGGRWDHTDDSVLHATLYNHTIANLELASSALHKYGRIKRRSVFNFLFSYPVDVWSLHLLKTWHPGVYRTMVHSYWRNFQTINLKSFAIECDSIATDTFYHSNDTALFRKRIFNKGRLIVSEEYLQVDCEETERPLSAEPGDLCRRTYLHGKAVEYYPSGNLKAAGNYVLGWKIDEWLYLDSKGENVGKKTRRKLLYQRNNYSCDKSSATGR